MRVLLIEPGPEFSVKDVYQGWKEALEELGCEVAIYNTSDRLLFYSHALIAEAKDEFDLPIVRQAMTQDEAIKMAMQGLSHALYTFWPQVVLFVSGFFMESGTFELIRNRGHKIVILHTESPYEDDVQLTRASFADLNLLNDPANISAYRELGPALYMPHAYRPQVHHPRTGPVNTELASDLIFIGTGFKSRVAFFERMDFTGIDFLLGGSYWEEETTEDSPLRKFLESQKGECVDNAETAELYRHAKCGINFYRREAEDSHTGEGWAMGPREVEMAASGLFFLRDPRPETDKVLHMLPSFASPEDASEQLRWWLGHEAERNEAARAARLAVADRTFVNNAARMLRALEEL